MSKRGRRVSPKTDGSSIPGPPPYLRDEEKVWYQHFADACRRSAYAVGIDADSIALAAQRKTRLEMLRSQFFHLNESQHWIVSDNGATKAHPLFGEIRHATREVDMSLTQLFLTPKSRSSSRIGGVREVPQAVETSDPQKAKILKLLGG